MKTKQKLYVALAMLLLAVLGLYWTNRQQASERKAHAADAASSSLPTLGLAKEQVEQLTKITVQNGTKSTVTLEKKGENWELTAPVGAKANAANVRSLLDNLVELKATGMVDSTESAYGSYELTPEKGLQVVAYKGADKVLDLTFGKSGSRGQTVRSGERPGVFLAKGYQAYLYNREVKNWRETSILKFEDANVVQVEITNKHGKLSFSKNGENWSASRTERDGSGALASAPLGKWEKFDASKLQDMLRAYKSLNAEDFGDSKSDTGLGAAEKEGGIVRIVLKDNAGDLTLKVGKVKEGSSRFATREGGDDTVYVLSSWTGDWATAEAKKFEKADEKKGDKDAKGDKGDQDGEDHEGHDDHED